MVLLAIAWSLLVKHSKGSACPSKSSSISVLHLSRNSSQSALFRFHWGVLYSCILVMLERSVGKWSLPCWSDMTFQVKSRNIAGEAIVRSRDDNDPEAGCK